MSQNITQPIQVVQRSEIGLKRAVNQDSIGVRLPTAGEPSQHALFVVADGVGGNLPKGEVASRTAIEAMFAHYYAESDESDILMRVGDSLQDTNIAVRDQAAAEGVNSIGTTIVGLALAPNGEAIGFNVGDSRLYRVRGGGIELISEDQVSLPEPGVLKDEFKARRVTKISSYIGQPNLLEPNFYRLKTQPGDIYLLCSDGVWSKLEDEELLQNIDRQPLDQTSERIVKLVYERGAPDNLSLILIQLETPTKSRAIAEPIGEMPTAITTKPSASPSSSGGRNLTPFIIGGVVIAVIIGAVLLLSNQSATVPATPTVAALAVSSATSQPSITIPAAAVTNADATQTLVPTTAVASAVKTTDTALPTATKTSTMYHAPSRTPVPAATVTVTQSPTATPTLNPTRTHTSTPTTAPTVVALVVATDTAVATSSPTLKPSATHTETPTPSPTPVPSDTPSPSQTPLPTVTFDPKLITYTPSPRPTSTPSLTPTLSPTPTATATHTDTPTATATHTATPSDTPTLTLTPSPTLTPTITLTPTSTYTPSLTPNAKQAAQTATAQARITPTVTPTLYAPRTDDVITLSQSITFYPSTDANNFTLPTSGSIELPANTIVKVISSQSTPIDGLIYSYVTLQGTVEGVTAQTGWTALAPAAQATVTAHIQGGVIIRKGTGQGYDRQGIGLKDGERAIILGQATYRKQLWYYIDPENPQSSPGWIYAGVKDLQIEGNASNVPQRSYPPEPTATASPVPSETLTPAS